MVWCILFYLVLRETSSTAVGDAIADSLISNGFIAITAFIITNSLRYYHPQSYTYIFALGGSLIMTLLWLFVTDVVLGFIYNENEKLLYVEGLQTVRFSFGFIIHCKMMMLGLIWGKMGAETAEQSRKTETEAMLREAELFNLRRQLQPHFLFNSLNSISALIGIDPGKARNMVYQLSEFLRGTIKRDDTGFITFEEELEHLQLYLDIEKVRFGHRLHHNIHSSEEALSAKLPPLLLQPIMENAIKFGLYGTTGEVEINLNAEIVDNYLFLTVSNPFDTDTQTESGNGTRFGLKSIRRRLYLLYARNDLLTTQVNENQFIVTLKIPFKK